MKASEHEFALVLEGQGASLREAVWAGMRVNHVRAKADARAPLRDPESLCTGTHWGVVLTGKMKVSYEEGGEEIIAAGETFYIPPRHRALFLEDTHYLEFTPITDPA